VSKPHPQLLEAVKPVLDAGGYLSRGPRHTKVLAPRGELVVLLPNAGKPPHERQLAGVHERVSRWLKRCRRGF
jgi:hypothetical protein